MSSSRVCPAHPFFRSAAVLLDLFDPLLPPFSRPALQLLQSFLLIDVQTFPVCSRTLWHFHQFLRGPGGIGLYMGGIGGYQPATHQPFLYTLPYHFFK